MSKIDMRKVDMRRSITAMDEKMIGSTLNQVSDKGRQILKELEDFKFTLQQTSRILQNNQQMVKNLDTKRKTVDEISNKLYQLVFDVENIDITTTFEQQNMEIRQDMTNKSPAGEEQDSPMPPNMSNPNGPMSPDGLPGGGPGGSGGGFGGGGFGGGPSGPSKGPSKSDEGDKAEHNKSDGPDDKDVSNNKETLDEELDGGEELE